MAKTISKTKSIAKTKTGKKKPNIVKRVVKYLGIFVAAVFVLIIGAFIAIYVIVDKPFVESQMESALHRHVTIGDVSVSVFSALSGIEVKDVMISNYKTEKELKKLSGKEVSAGDRFVTLKKFTFKVAFGPLLQKKFVLKQLVLSGLDANIVRNKSGLYNFDDLISSKAAVKETKKEETKKEVSKPLSADDIPVKISIGKVGLENGNINFLDAGTGQKVNVYSIVAEVFGIEIDPKDLNSADIVKIKAGLGIKTIGETKGGAVQSFDITGSLNGSVIPFDKKTRLLNPEVSVKAASPKGVVSGLQIFESMKDLGALEKFSGKLDFLKNEIKWSNADVSLWYKGNTAKITDGKIKTEDFSAKFAATLNTASLSLNAPVDFNLSQKHTDKMRQKVKSKIDKLVAGKAKNIVNSDKLTDTAMKPLVGSDGTILIKYQINGTVQKPDAKMVAPELPDLKDLITGSAGDILDNAKDAAKAKATEAANKKINEQTNKAQDKAKGNLKNLFKK